MQRAYRRRISGFDRREGAGRGGASAGQSSRQRREAKKLYGLTNFSASNYLATAAGGGETGINTGFGIVHLLQNVNTPSASYRLGSCGWNGVAGYTAEVSSSSGAMLYFATIADGGGVARNVASQTLPLSEAGRLHVWYLAYDGAAIISELWRGEGARTFAMVGYNAAAAARRQLLGGDGTLSYPGVALASLAFRGAPTAAQRKALFDAIRARGDVPDTLDGATITHRWSARDELRGTIVASNQSAPAQLTDTTTRAAADALIRAGFGVQRSNAGAFLGIGPYVQTTTYLKTAINGGIQGGPTMHVVADVWLTKVPTALEHWVSCEGTGGWYLIASATGVLGIGLGSVGEVPIYQLTAADLNKTLRIVLNSINKNIELWINGTYAGNWNAGTYITTANASMLVGQRFTDTRAFTSGYVKLVQGGSTTSLNAGEIAAANADLTQPPPIVSGKTQKRYLFETDVTAANGPLPAKFTELMAGAAVDDLTVVGAGVRVRVIDPTIDGRRTLGAQGFSASNHLRTAGGVRGSASGFWGHLFWRPDVSGGLLALAACTVGGADGWQLYLSSTNLTINLVATPNTVLTGSAVLATSDFGQPQQAQYVYDGAQLRLYYKRSLVATSGALSGYAATAVAMTLGCRADGSIPSSNASIFGFQGGDGYVPTLAELQQAYDDTERTGRITAIPGSSGATLKTQHSWDLTTDILASGVDAVPATVLDRAGTDHLTRMGGVSSAGGLTLAQRTERVWSYETSPILYGATTQASTAGNANHYMSALNSLPGDPAAFGVSVLCRCTGQVGAASRSLFAQRTGGNPGWFMNTSGTNSAFVFSVGGASTSINAASMTIAAADIGKLFLLTGTWDGTAARLYAKRALVGAVGGAVLGAAYVPNPLCYPRILRREDGACSDQIEVYGVAYWVGLASLAQIQAQHDAVMALERIQLPPGLVGTLIDIDADTRANGGALPATLTDRSLGGVSFARQGTPDLTALYARSWGW